MRRTTIALLAVVVASALVGCRHVQAPPRSDVAVFRSEVERLRSELALPGLSIAVARNGRIVWTEGFGYADLAANVPATPDTPYEIASVSKPLGATLLMQLVEQGKLRLDDPMPSDSHDARAGAVTVRHVLTHTSGGVPGTKYEYNGNAFDTLTDVVIAASGVRYRKLLADRIIDPAGMTSTSPGNDIADGLPNMEALLGAPRAQHYAAILRALAKPYRLYGDGELVPTSEPQRGIGTANGVVSTVRDLLRFDRAVDAHLFVTAATQELMWRNATLRDGSPIPYGLGWFVQNIGGTRVVWHNGFLPDRYSALYLKVPSQQLTLVALANSGALSAPFHLARGDVRTSALACAFLATVAKLPAGDCRAQDETLIAEWRDGVRKNAHHEVKLDAGALLRFAGRYRFDSGSVVEVKPSGDHLELAGSTVVELYAEGPDRFFAKANDIQYTFGSDAAGEIVTLTARQDDEQAVATRVR